MPMPLRSMMNLARAEIEAELARAGISMPGAVEMEDISALRSLDPGDFRQTLEKIALYKWGDDTPLTSEDSCRLCPPAPMPPWTMCCTPWPRPAPNDIGPFMARLKAQGVAPVTLCVSRRCGISGRCIWPPAIPTEQPQASPRCAHRSLAPDATVWCARRRTGAQLGWIKRGSLAGYRFNAAVGGSACPRYGIGRTCAHPVIDAGCRALKPLLRSQITTPLVPPKIQFNLC